jgi:hypothetical protein
MTKAQTSDAETLVGQLYDAGELLARVDYDPTFASPTGAITLDVSERMTYLSPHLADVLGDLLREAAAKARGAR